MRSLRVLIGFQLFLICVNSLVYAQASTEPAPVIHQPIHSLSSPCYRDTGTVGKLKFSPNGEMLACYCSHTSGKIMDTNIQSKLRVINVQSGMQQLSIPEGWRGFAFSPDNKCFLTWNEKYLSCWTFANSDPIETIALSNVQEVSFIRGGQGFVTKAFEPRFFEPTSSEVKFWDTKTLKHIPTPIDQRGPWVDPIVTPNGKLLIGFKDAKCNIVEIETGTPHPAPLNVITSLYLKGKLSLDGRNIFLSGPNGSFVCWNLQTFQSRSLGSFFNLAAEGVDMVLSSQQNIAFSPITDSLDDSSLYVGYHDSKWQLKDLISDQIVREFPDPTNRIPSPKDRVLCLNSDRMVLWLIPDSKPDSQLPGPSTYIVDLLSGKILSKIDNSELWTYRPSSNVLVFHDKSNQETVNFWNAKTGKEMGKLSFKGIPTIVFSPDNRHFATSDQSSVRIWRLSQFGEAD